VPRSKGPATAARRVGVISDTHGLLRPSALGALRGCDPIIHAGDVGDPGIIAALEEIAPLFVVRGNVDRADWARRLPPNVSVEIDGRLIYVLHDIAELDFDPAAAGFHAVIYGHSHRPSAERKSGVLYLNPGSAGPRRFDLPVTLAHLTLAQGVLTPEIIDIGAGQAPHR
jgi:putative phosphoesterase